MAEDFAWNDRYAGDGPWTEWFRICSVAGCAPEAAKALRAEIESSMYAHLSRCGFSREDAGSDDPVAFFDAYFKLKGSRETRKPLKSYFAYRIEVERIPLVSFVCGTLFGSASGRVRAIVVDWIAALKGWKPRTVYGADGRRHLEWEGASAEGARDFAADGTEAPGPADPARFLDEGPIRLQIEQVLEALAQKINVEKPLVALLLYATAQDIPITEPAVLEAFGTGKSRAYAVRDKMMKELRRELVKVEGADDPLFGRLLLECCEAALPGDVRRKLGGEA